jgi:hypothetical protein
VNDSQLDTRLAGAARDLIGTPVDTLLLKDAASLDVVKGWSRGRPALGGLLLAAGAVLAVVVFRQGTSTPFVGTTDHASIVVGSSRIDVRRDGEQLHVMVGSVDVVEPIELSMRSFFAAQLVCSPSYGLTDHPVVVGYVAGGDAVSVQGLGAGQSALGSDGSFAFAASSKPTPGTLWTALASGGRSVSAYYAGWGHRNILPAESAASRSSEGCVMANTNDG